MVFSSELIVGSLTLNGFQVAVGAIEKLASCQAVGSSCRMNQDAAYFGASRSAMALFSGTCW